MDIILESFRSEIFEAKHPMCSMTNFRRWTQNGVLQAGFQHESSSDLVPSA